MKRIPALIHQYNAGLTIKCVSRKILTLSLLTPQQTERALRGERERARGPFGHSQLLFIFLKYFNGHVEDF